MTTTTLVSNQLVSVNTFENAKKGAMYLINKECTKYYVLNDLSSGIVDVNKLGVEAANNMIFSLLRKYILLCYVDIIEQTKQVETLNASLGYSSDDNNRYKVSSILKKIKNYSIIITDEQKNTILDYNTVDKKVTLNGKTFDMSLIDNMSLYPSTSKIEAVSKMSMKQLKLEAINVVKMAFERCKLADKIKEVFNENVNTLDETEQTEENKAA